jgi:hypothetical protein
MGTGKLWSPPNPIGLSEVTSRGFIHTDSKEALTLREILAIQWFTRRPEYPIRN